MKHTYIRVNSHRWWMIDPPRSIIGEIIDNDHRIIGITEVGKGVIRISDVQGQVVEEVGLSVHHVGWEDMSL